MRGGFNSPNNFFVNYYYHARFAQNLDHLNPSHSSHLEYIIESTDFLVSKLCVVVGLVPGF